MRRVWLPRRVHRHGDDDEPVASRVEPAQAAAPANPPRDALGLGHPIPSLSRRIRKSPPRRRTLYIKGTEFVQQVISISLVSKGSFLPFRPRRRMARERGRRCGGL